MDRYDARDRNGTVIGRKVDNLVSDMNCGELVRSLIKILHHFWFGTCEIERICEAHHNALMSINFATSVSLTKKMPLVRQCVFSGEIFDSASTLNDILKVKNIDSTKRIVILNISHCLNAFLYVNVIICELNINKLISFEKSDRIHCELLEAFWTNMKPGVRRSQDSEGHCSSSWGDLGFQGKDPATDFRGMGLLALIQLHHFSKERPSVARSILLESQNNRRYYPFAATGINFTAFVLELLRETRLHRLLFHQLEKRYLEFDYLLSDGGPASCVPLLQVGVEAVHTVYCDLFIEFNVEWVKRNPENLMEFQKIYASVKKRFRDMYPPISLAVSITSM